MESFTSGKHLKNYLVQIFHFLNEAAVVQRGEGTVPRSHSNQHQSQQPPDPGQGVVWLMTSIALCSVSCGNKITVLKIQRQTVHFLYKSFSPTLKNVIFLLIQFSKKLKMAYNEALAIKQGRKEWREGGKKGGREETGRRERKEVEIRMCVPCTHLCMVCAWSWQGGQGMHILSEIKTSNKMVTRTELFWASW